MGYKEIPSGNIRDCLYSERDMDYSTWYVDKNGDFRCDAIHHDGTNHYLYRAYKDGVSDTQIENLKEKAEAFGFKTIEINGHDYDEISDALDTREEGKPVCVIANTIKGKGLACAENQAGWHHKTPSLEQVEQLKEDMAEYRKELA